MTLGIWLYLMPPSLAVPLVLICSVVGQSSTLPSMWRSFDLTLIWPFLIGGLAGVPLGTIDGTRRGAMPAGGLRPDRSASDVARAVSPPRNHSRRLAGRASLSR